MPMKHPHPRTAFVALLALFALLATACGGSDSVETKEPEPTTAPADPTPDPTTGSDGAADGVATDDGTGAGDDTADADDDNDAGGADTGNTDEGVPVDAPVTVLVAVETSGGFVSVNTALSTYPELVVMSDGSVYRPGDQIATFPPPLTPALELLQLTRDQLSAITTAVAAASVVAADTDFGSPAITDAPTTAFTAFVDGVAIELAAYALDTDDAIDGPTQQARINLRQLITEISTIVDGATSTGVLTEPPALAARTFAGLTFQEDAQVRPWPIESLPMPQPGGIECVVITGEELSTLWAAAADATTQTPWNINGQAKVVALRPVFPHETICS